jgi:hypothetical protein
VPAAPVVAAPVIPVAIAAIVVAPVIPVAIAPIVVAPVIPVAAAPVVPASAPRVEVDAKVNARLMGAVRTRRGVITSADPSRSMMSR